MERHILSQLLPIGYECKHLKNHHQIAYITGLSTDKVTLQIISDAEQVFISQNYNFKSALEELKNKGFNTILEEGTSKIYEWRRIRAISQKELAEKIGVTQKDISRWETGERNPKLDKLTLIAQALECDLQDLI